MGRYIHNQVKNALASRPAPKGVLIPVPKHERYVFCPETDWLYSTKMKQCEFYPLKLIEPTEWNEQFEGWKVTDNGYPANLTVQYLRSLKPKEENFVNLQNSASTNPYDYKGKFLIGSIHKKTGAVSFTTNPARQPTRAAAQKEAERLAGLDKEKMFMVVEVTDIAMTRDVVFI